MPAQTDQDADDFAQRVRAELSAQFVPGRELFIASEPGWFDVMGGITTREGGGAIRAPIAAVANVAVQRRDDDVVQLFSFNEYEAHCPFTINIPTLLLRPETEANVVTRELAKPGRGWAATFVEAARQVMANHPEISGGFDVAIANKIPGQVGLKSRAALMRAVGRALVSESSAPVGSDWLVQSSESAEPLPMRRPDTLQAVGFAVRRNSNVAERLKDADIATTMALRIVHNTMVMIGERAGRKLVGDPLAGQLANLDPDAYKAVFRSHLPEFIWGKDFIGQYGVIDNVDAHKSYPVQHLADHHVLEARRIRRFEEFIAKSVDATGFERLRLLNMAGHLMYTSHQSYTNDAMLGDDRCDVLVQLIRQREPAGFYGARMSAAGGGGTVVAMYEGDDQIAVAAEEIAREFKAKTGEALVTVAGI